MLYTEIKDKVLLLPNVALNFNFILNYQKVYNLDLTARNNKFLLALKFAHFGNTAKLKYDDFVHFLDLNRVEKLWPQHAIQIVR